MEDVALPSIPSHVRLSFSSMTRPTVVGTVAEIITYVIQSIEHLLCSSIDSPDLTYKNYFYVQMMTCKRADVCLSIKVSRVTAPNNLIFDL